MSGSDIMLTRCLGAT